MKIFFVLIMSVLLSATSNAATCSKKYQIDWLGAEAGYVKFSVDDSSFDVGDVAFYVQTPQYSDVADIIKLAYSMNYYVKFKFTGANSCSDNQMDNVDDYDLKVYEVKIYEND